MTQTHPKLSPIKEIYCINCHEELILDLAERRGEKQIICPKCKTSFSIKKAEKFMSNISPITEGQCPSCLEELIFDPDDRIGDKKIKCPICGDYFYIDETVTYQTTHKIEKKRAYHQNNNTYSILKYYFPEVEVHRFKHGTDYYIKDDNFNKNLFLTWFIILDLSLALIVHLVNKPLGKLSWKYTFGDWLLDFVGWALGFLIPSLIVSWIIAKSVKSSRKLSQKEIDEFKNDYNTRK